MTLYGPYIPIRVELGHVPDPGLLPGREPGELPDREPAAPVREPAGEPARVPASWSDDEHV